MRLIPMSISELAWDLFYESEALRHYRRWVASNTGAQVIQQNWCRVEVNWERGKPGRPVARLKRVLPRTGVGMRGHRHLRFCGGIGAGAVVRLIINGQVHELHGRDETKHYTVPIRGGRIRSLEFEVVAKREGAGGVALIWTALVDMRRDKERLAPQAYYDENWEGLLVPPGKKIEPQVGIGLLFDQRDLPGLRRKIKTELYAPWMELLRAHARKLMGVKPEALIGRFACQALHYTRPLERDSLTGIGGYPSPWDPFSWLALTGLLDGDAKMLRHAARWMLSVASCEYWYNDFAGELPGTRFHHRSFTEAHVTEWMSLALDWAGSALTEEGQAVVRDAISRRGLPRIQQDFVEYDYIRSMNQGIVFNTGRILGLLALRQAWPLVEGRLREAREDEWDMFDKTFTRDGGSVEGPGYWLYTLQVGLLGVMALARHVGRPPADLVPRKLRRAPAYPFAFASTANLGMSLPIADSRGSPICSGGLAAMFTRAFPGEASNRLAAWALRHPDFLGDPAQAIIFGPARVGKITSLVPEFLTQRDMGHLLVCRKLPGVGLVRLQFYGAPGGSGSHSHDDRGNILLEAGGESVLVDRGIGNYNNPRMLVKRAEAHNVFVPAMPDGSVPRQSLDHQNDIVPRASYRGGVLRAVITTTGAWPRHVKACRRRVFSPAPGVFEIADELELTHALPATFHLHTPCAMRQEGKTVVLKGKRVRVFVQPEWRPDKILLREEDMGIGALGRSYGHLQLIAAPARKHRLVTRITIQPQKSS